MGAVNFATCVYGKDASEAFATAKAEALWEHGHAGYTGSIAEKDSFIILNKPEEQSAQDFINSVLEEDASPVSNKWGPAGCISLGPSEKEKGKFKFIFFGFASS